MVARRSARPSLADEGSCAAARRAQDREYHPGITARHEAIFSTMTMIDA
jgi:hypothetical protein